MNSKAKDKVWDLLGKQIDLQKSVKNKTTLIGDALVSCGLHDIWDEKPKNHLSEWFERFWYRGFQATPEELITMHEQCSFCAQAYELIQERKIVKRKLSATKGAITRIVSKSAGCK